MDHQHDILLEDDHTKLDAILQLVFEALGNRDRAATFENLDYFWALLAVHIRAEHLHLFPILLQKVRGLDLPKRLVGLVDRLPDHISALRRDHDFFVKEIGKDVNRLRRDNPKGENFEFGEIHKNLLVVRQRLDNHNDQEENDIYPLAEVLLTGKEMTDLKFSIIRELANIPPRFHSLSEKKQGK